MNILWLCEFEISSHLTLYTEELKNSHIGSEHPSFRNPCVNHIDNMGFWTGPHNHYPEALIFLLETSKNQFQSTSSQYSELKRKVSSKAQCFKDVKANEEKGN